MNLSMRLSSARSIALAFALLVFSWRPVAYGAESFPCATDPAALDTLLAEVIHRDGEEIQQVWVFEDSDELWAAKIPPLGPLEKYRRWLAERGGSEVPAEMFLANRRLRPRRPELPPLQHRINQAVENGALGHLRPMNCLESHLLSYQVNRSSVDRLRELSAYLLTHAEHREVKVYFLSGKGVFPPQDKLVRPLIEEDQSAGWVLAGHIHNHTVVFEENEMLFFPVPAPSTSDAQYGTSWAEAGLRRFIVLDGFSAGDIAGERLLRFLAEPAEESSFDLLQIERIEPKGRVQDHDPGPVIGSILARGRAAIPPLIDLIESERLYAHRPLDFWPDVREGDMALILLSHLFLDPTLQKSSLPQLCWDTLLERADAEDPAWRLLARYIETHGRSTLADKWRAAWCEHHERIAWNEEDHYFGVVGRALVACRQVR